MLGLYSKSAEKCLLYIFKIRSKSFLHKKLLGYLRTFKPKKSLKSVKMSVAKGLKFKGRNRSRNRNLGKMARFHNTACYTGPQKSAPYCLDAALSHISCNFLKKYIFLIPAPSEIGVGLVILACMKSRR
jgi:hypothetical protein